MALVYISLGSNCGDREKNVMQAAEWIDNLLGDTCRSEIYETPEINGYGPSYFNSVIM
ncbi:MAG: 2-amino-4-hydroxy-6-hydroxymethyldihydropteridine diphosphokinase, partial [Muribaculaceae bacterium]|nr:2-amino-4-hydroxy-6-hydroxymethyldihydropteridine diphosphokinase [Muribaculaceae bacterium]